MIYYVLPCSRVQWLSLFPRKLQRAVRLPLEPPISRLDSVRVPTFSQDMLRSPSIIFLAFHHMNWRTLIPFLFCGAQYCTQHSRWVCTNCKYRENYHFLLAGYAVCNAVCPFDSQGTLLAHVEPTITLASPGPFLLCCFLAICLLICAFITLIQVHNLELSFPKLNFIDDCHAPRFLCRVSPGTQWHFPV